MKCDETKPACLRCTSTGRKCVSLSPINFKDSLCNIVDTNLLTLVMQDGYDVAKPARAPDRVDANDAAQRPKRALARIPATGIVKQLTIVIPGTDSEVRGFHFFKSLTAVALVEGVNSPSWARFILQTSHTSDTVRLAAAALGMLTERFHVHEVLTTENEQAISRDGAALVQYSNAIQKLHAEMNEDSQQAVEFALTACFLLLVFEFFQGNDRGTALHFANGIQILYRYLDKLHAQSPNPVYSATTRQIISMFSLTDLQAAIWHGTLSFASTIIARRNMHPPGTPTPLSLERPYTPYENPDDIDTLQTLVQAAMAHARDFTMAYHFFREASIHEDETLPHRYPTWILEQREILIRRTERWPDALSDMLSRIAPIGIEDGHRKDVLMINHIALLLKLRASLQPDEKSVYTVMTSKFEEIVRIAKTLLRPVNLMIQSNLTHVSNIDKSIRPIPMFSFVGGLIEPLFMTAMRCQDFLVSLEAVSLLETKPWREGAWDSAAMAKLARRNLGLIEEVDLGQGSAAPITGTLEAESQDQNKPHEVPFRTRI